MNMHPRDFLIDRDVTNDGQVTNARTLDVGIIKGHQTLPPQEKPELTANRLLIFAGTAIVEKSGDRDEVIRGVIRVRLRFPLSASVEPVGSASLAALATISGNEANVLLGADNAETVRDPTAGGQLPRNGLPDDELYLIVDAAVASTDATIQRIAYQANVLIQDTTPDLDSLLVRRFPTDQFSTSADVEIRHDWEFQITLTGPVVDPPGQFTVNVQSDQDEVPIFFFGGPRTQASFTLSTGETSVIIRAPFTRGLTTATITAVGNRVTKTATVRVFRIG
jgi:hypothetical protein